MVLRFYKGARLMIAGALSVWNKSFIIYGTIRNKTSLNFIRSVGNNILCLNHGILYISPNQLLECGLLKKKKQI